MNENSLFVLFSPIYIYIYNSRINENFLLICIIYQLVQRTLQPPFKDLLFLIYIAKVSRMPTFVLLQVPWLLRDLQVNSITSGHLGRVWTLNLEVYV